MREITEFQKHELLLTVKYRRSSQPHFTENWVYLDMGACPVEAVKATMAANKKL